MTRAGVHPSPMYCDQENKIPRYKHGCRAPTSNVKSQVVLKEEWIGSQKTPQDMSCQQCALIFCLKVNLMHPWKGISLISVLMFYKVIKLFFFF